MSVSNILDRGMTEAQGRALVASLDRRSWYPGTRVVGRYGIISGKDDRDVAVFDRRTDRDAVVAMARSVDALRSSLANAVLLLQRHPEYADHVEEAEQALNLASGLRP